MRLQIFGRVSSNGFMAQPKDQSEDMIVSHSVTWFNVLAFHSAKLKSVTACKHACPLLAVDSLFVCFCESLALARSWKLDNRLKLELIFSWFPEDRLQLASVRRHRGSPATRKRAAQVSGSKQAKLVIPIFAVNSRRVQQDASNQNTHKSHSCTLKCS